MKRLLVLIICILSITLAGCIKDYPLSEAQTDIVAEYMANRLLHYDKHYSSSLLSYQEIYEIEPEPTDIRTSMMRIMTLMKVSMMRIMTLMKVTMMKIVILTGLYPEDIQYTLSGNRG